MHLMEDLKVLISGLYWDELNKIPEIINDEKCRRLKLLLVPGTKVETLQPGFGGWAGVQCEFISFRTQQNGIEIAEFGKEDKKPRWILKVSELAAFIKII